MKSLNVLLATDPSRPIKVGVLFQQQRKVYFEYDAEWLADGFVLSPYQLKLSSALIEDETGLWQGLHGVFNDSLPDGWGLLLMDRELRKSSIDPRSINRCIS
jgi:serine/threonine-protein kinase HipA